MRLINTVAIVGLTGLLVLALLARAWLGLTSVSQLDPTALLVSIAVATATLMFALPVRSDRASS